MANTATYLEHLNRLYDIEQKKLQSKVQTDNARLMSASMPANYAAKMPSSNQVTTSRPTNDGIPVLGGIGYAAHKLGLGFMRGVEGIWDFAAGGIADLIGFDRWAEKQVKNEWMNYNAADEWYNPSEGWKTVGDITQGLGTSGPALIPAAVGAIVTAASGGAGAPALAAGLKWTGVALAGLSAGGQGVSEAYDKTGKLGGAEWAYGTATGAVEAGLELATGNVDILARPMAKGGQAAAKATAKTAVKNAARQGIIRAARGEFMQEAFEEGMAEFISPYLARATYDPNAENATLQQIAYSAFVGGMSGALMGGLTSAGYGAAHTLKGNNLTKSGQADVILRQAEIISRGEQADPSGSEVVATIESLANDLRASMEKTGGEIKTLKQKSQLGDLNAYIAAHTLNEATMTSAQDILGDPEKFAAELTNYGYTDADGNRITYTAEQLLEGIKRDENGKIIPKSLYKALQNNPTLRTLAIADAAAHLMMDTEAFGDNIFKRGVTQDQLNQFVERGSEKQKAELGALLGVEDWESVDVYDLSARVDAFLENGGRELLANREFAMEEFEQARDKTFGKKIPKRFGNKKDGIYRYKEGDADIAIRKEGDSYTIYDYAERTISFDLSKNEVNAALKQYADARAELAKSDASTETVSEEGAKQEASSTSDVDGQTGTDARKVAPMSDTAAEIAAYARENVKHYPELNARNKRTIRRIIREGRAKGVAENVILDAANVAAHAKIDVIFDHDIVRGTKQNANGFYSPRNETMYLDPEAKTIENVLIHELDHAIRKSVSADGTVETKISSEAVGAVTEDFYKETLDKYTDGKKMPLAKRIERTEDEVEASYAAEVFASKKLVRHLVADKRSLMQKIKAFFNRAQNDYSGVPRLEKQAKRYYKQFKAWFDEFAAERTYKTINSTSFVIPTDAVSFNLAYADTHKKELVKRYSADDAVVPLATIEKQYDTVLRIWNKLGGELDSEFMRKWDAEKGKDRVFTLFKEQQGYKYNVELSTMCKKGIPLFEAIDYIVREEISKEMNLPVISKQHKEILYDLLKKNGFEIPCAICYVEQARQREGDIINSFLNGKGKKLGWNSTLDTIEREMANRGAPYAFPKASRDITTTAYTPAANEMTEAEQKVFFDVLRDLANAEIERYNEEDRKKGSKRRIPLENTTPEEVTQKFKGNLSSNLMMFKVLFTESGSRMRFDDDMLYSSATTQNISAYHPTFYTLFNTQGGVSGYKTKQGTAVYWGDVLTKQGSTWIPSAIRREGGIRNQSNSDFQMYTFLDQVQMYLDLTARGFYLHAYTKTLTELKLFGLSGAKLNASLIPSVVLRRNADGSVNEELTRKYAGLDENGNPIYDDIEGIPHEEAFMLLSDEAYSRSVAGICIGYSDEHIFKLLDEDRVQLIIGFHDKTNDGTKRYKGARYAKNYNGENETILKSRKTEHVAFNKFVLRAESKFKHNEQTNTFSGTCTFRGKTYKANDIPRLAADMYLDECARKGSTPAYDTFKNHPNYYKLLADFGLYDSKGRYAPHSKVAFRLPSTVPYLDANGNRASESTEAFIKRELAKELTVRDKIATALADRSEGAIIPEYIRRVNALTSTEDSSFSLEDGDTEYLSAVERGDMETAQRMVDEAAKRAMPQSKITRPDGSLRKVYHGTNTGDFTVFNPDYIGMSSGDDGFFGKGFYFAYSEGEAKYYGAKRIIPAYLNLTNPFDFRRELQTFNGKRAVSGRAPDAVAFLNFAEKFPDIAAKTFVDVYDGEAGRQISLVDFAKSYRDVIENKKFEYQPVENEFGEKETLVLADKTEHTYEDNGVTRSYVDYGFQKRFWGEANELDVAYEYLSTVVYHYIDMYSRNRLIIDRNDEFTAKLREMGYDGAIQSQNGDEAVAFFPEQIKSADPVTYDDNGNVIPLSKRFDPMNDDIRFSLDDTVTNDADGHRADAVETFGTTNDFKVAGFVLPDGRMLNMGTLRASQRHQSISKVLPNVSKEDAVPAFLREGNVRIAADSPGIEMSADARPTTSQLNVLSRFVSASRNKGRFYVDITAANGNEVGSLSYYGGEVNAEIIVGDIKRYYDTGRLPANNEISFSLSDSEGNSLSAEQQEFFKDSKVRWGDRLMPVYHGTRREFTVFDATKGYDDNKVGGLLWAAKDYEYAKDYSYSDEPIVMKGYLNITNLLDVGAIDNYPDYESRLQEIADLVKLAPSELEAMVNYKNPVIFDITSSKGFRDRIVELGYDGVEALESGLQTFGFVDSNQFKDTTNKAPTSDPDIRFSLDDSSGGYDGYSMSNRARRAYANGEMPLSKWTKSAIVEAVADINPDIDISKLNLETLRSRFVRRSSWHHTSMHYNRTDFYSIDKDFVSWLTQSNVDEIATEQAQKPKKSPKPQRNASLDDQVADVYRKASLLVAAGIYRQESAAVKKMLSAQGESAYEIALETIRKNDAEKVERWRRLPENHWRQEYVKLYDSDIEAYAMKEYGIEDKKLSKNSNVFKDILQKISSVDANTDVSFSLEDTDTDYNAIIEKGAPIAAPDMTVGQMLKRVANNTHYKVFSKGKILKVVKNFSGMEFLTAKDAEEFADAIWQNFNALEDVESVQEFAHDMARFIFARFMVDGRATKTVDSEVKERYDALSTYIQRITFSEADVEEIKKVMDSDGLKRIYGRWGYKGGKEGRTSRVPMDVFVTDIANEVAGFSYLEEMHPADAFMELNKVYEKAREEVFTKTEQAFREIPDEELDKMVGDIEKSITDLFKNEADVSAFGKRMDEILHDARVRVNHWKCLYDRQRQRYHALNNLKYLCNKIEDLTTHKFKSATQEPDSRLDGLLKQLPKIVSGRGTVNVDKARELFTSAYQIYSSNEFKKNVLMVDTESGTQGLYCETVEKYLKILSGDNQAYNELYGNMFPSDGEGLSFAEIDLAGRVLSYFIKLYRDYGKVYRQGVLVDIQETAEGYISVFERNKNIAHKNIIRRSFTALTGSTFMQAVEEPLSVFRRADFYAKDGFWTEIGTQLRNAAFNAEIARVNVMREYDAFLNEKPSYMRDASEKTVELDGVQIPKIVLLSLYCTLKREHAWKGFAINGYGFIGLDGNKVNVRGPLSDGIPWLDVMPETTADERAEIARKEFGKVAAEKRAEIEKLLTEEDREYIRILEKIYNEEARRLKMEQDFARFGFTNVSDDYYYPIRRDSVYKSIDAAMRAELDRVSNASFNKDIVEGASTRLFIESADSLVRRHVDVVCQYANLTPVIDFFNAVYNHAVNGNTGAPENLRDANTWQEGEAYVRQLIGDIQGVNKSSDGQWTSTIRGASAAAALGANPKVLLTQLTSLVAAANVIDFSSILKGVGAFFTGQGKDVNDYSAIAELRQYEGTSAMAQAVVDRRGVQKGTGSRMLEGIKGVSDKLTYLISVFDRGVVVALFSACQYQVAKDSNGEFAVGTQQNKIRAAQLLNKVIIETQQNTVATEKSAWMRGGAVTKGLTMFSADAMKNLGRFIDAVGESMVLSERLKGQLDDATRAEYVELRKQARRRGFTALAVLLIQSAMMVGLSQLFKWLYAKDDEEETAGEVAWDITGDFLGGMFSGLPIVRDAITIVFDRFEMEDRTLAPLNDVMSAVVKLGGAVRSIFSDEDNSKQHIASAVKTLVFSLSNLVGIPVRNLYNQFYGLADFADGKSKKFKFQIDEFFYKKNYESELKKAIEDGDFTKAGYIFDLVFDERAGSAMSRTTRNELFRLAKKGYKMLPPSVPDSITIDGKAYTLTEKEKGLVQEKYETYYNEAIGKLVENSTYTNMGDAEQAETIDRAFGYIKEKALHDVTGKKAANSTLVAHTIGYDKAAVVNQRISAIEGDKDKYGDTITGSRKKKIASYLSKQPLSDGARILMLYANGFGYNDGDIGGMSKSTARAVLLKYIVNNKRLTKEEKLQLAKMCDFTVKNGNIVP